MMAAPVVCIFNAEYAVQNQLRNMVLLILALTYAVCLLIFLLIYVLTHRVQITVLLGVSGITFYGIANSFIREFRGNGIRTSDIYAIKTAMNVSGGYDLVFTPHRACVILLAFAFVFLAFHCRYKKTGFKSRIPVAIVTLSLGLLLQKMFWNEQFMEDNWIAPYKWELEESARYHGAILEFVAGIPYLLVEKPDNYSAAKAEQFIEDSQKAEAPSLVVETDLDGEKPDIIVIMNESFSDLSVLGTVETDDLEYFYSLDKDVIRGSTSVPILGGLTANSEFEFLTGFSTAFFPAGTIAYQNYVKSDTPNLNDVLKEQGYYSIFMHPMSSSGWNRKNVYDAFAFDEQLYYDDYENKEMLRGMVSDSSNYKELIARYEHAKEENENVFIFNVTMQNHGGYTYGIDTTVHLTNIQGSYPAAEEYLTLIKESDQAFKELISYFSQKDDPVLICMFGDHQPTMPTEFYEEVQAANGVSDFMNLSKKYQTPFLLYANYDIEEAVYDNISLNYLNVLLMEAAGLEWNEYQTYLASLYESYPVINTYGVKDANGNWYEWYNAENFEEIQKYLLVQYRYLFD